VGLQTLAFVTGRKESRPTDSK
jgi:D-alanyl-D-alanine carboxypeptidase